MNTSNPRRTNTRDQVLRAYAQEQIARTSLSQDDFAQALSRTLHQKCHATADAERVPDFESDLLRNDTGEFIKAAGRWLKRVQRLLSGEQEMPCWMEEAWVAALEPEWRDRCVNELASRYGLTGARSQDGDFCPATSFGRLVKHIGGAVEACSAILADGQVDVNDAAELPGAIHELRSMIARAHELESRMVREAESAGTVLTTH
ncbi:hypothetical protein FXN65_10700 [Metapseudomonas lalkuanensis]|uniref:Uncharacterized protein n=1 Tax=Metapseudomonas lalkuanensis TaxID=2604832 RepID=A0A5J6QML3_9GAMM|nr:hypothetical protein [Pseudomonas lalkuanensis]QEY62521.1 hypothetical protein FXN65_10700 [Pseudomonas lalkuanensis]